LRLVFDTNVVVSALVFGARLAWLRAAWRDGRAQPVVCRATAEELLRVLAYPKFRLADAERDALLADYLPFCETATLPHPPPAVPACRDRADRIFVEFAVAARVDALVTGDADVAALRALAPLPILSASELRLRTDEMTP
jgi:putative PIN family toxin of toxin-antitoxin system